MLAADLSKPEVRQSGFIAQEVEAVVQETGASFNGVDTPVTEEGFYGLRYSEFVVPLVKAVQEQQVIINKLEEKLIQVQLEVEKLKSGRD